VNLDRSTNNGFRERGIHSPLCRLSQIVLISVLSVISVFQLTLPAA
jgi:hypothetical protein